MIADASPPDPPVPPLPPPPPLPASTDSLRVKVPTGYPPPNGFAERKPVAAFVNETLAPFPPSPPSALVPPPECTIVDKSTVTSPPQSEVAFADTSPMVPLLPPPLPPSSAVTDTDKSTPSDVAD